MCIHLPLHKHRHTHTHLFTYTYMLLFAIPILCRHIYVLYVERLSENILCVNGWICALYVDYSCWLVGWLASWLAGWLDALFIILAVNVDSSCQDKSYVQPLNFLSHTNSIQQYFLFVHHINTRIISFCCIVPLKVMYPTE